MIVVINKVEISLLIKKNNENDFLYGIKQAFGHH